MIEFTSLASFLFLILQTLLIIFYILYYMQLDINM